MESGRIFPEDAELLAASLSVHNRVTNWSFVLILAITVIVFGAPSGDNVQFLGIELRKTVFFPASGVTICLFNIYYCMSHIQATRAAAIFLVFAKANGGDELIYCSALQSGFLRRDALHSMYEGTIFRVYPVAAEIQEMFGVSCYRVIRGALNGLIVIVPYLGIFASLYITWRELPVIVTVILLPMLLISVVATLALYNAKRKFQRLASKMNAR